MSEIRIKVAYMSHLMHLRKPLKNLNLQRLGNWFNIISKSLILCCFLIHLIYKIYLYVNSKQNWNYYRFCEIQHKVFVLILRKMLPDKFFLLAYYIWVFLSQFCQRRTNFFPIVESLLPALDSHYYDISKSKSNSDLIRSQLYP